MEHSWKTNGRAAPENCFLPVTDPNNESLAKASVRRLDSLALFSSHTTEHGRIRRRCVTFVSDARLNDVQVVFLEWATKKMTGLFSSLRT